MLHGMEGVLQVICFCDDLDVHKNSCICVPGFDVMCYYLNISSRCTKILCNGNKVGELLLLFSTYIIIFSQHL